MYLDPRTIVIINIFSAGLLGIALLAVSRGYLKQVRGIFNWAIASLLHALSWILYALRGIVPDGISIILAMVILLLSLSYYFKIIAAFTDKAKRTDWVYYLTLIAIIGLAYFLWIRPDTAVRMVVISIASASLLYASGYVLLSGKESRPTSYTFTGLVFVFSGSILLFRAGYFLFWETDPNQAVLVQSGMQSVTFLTSYLTAAMLTFGFLLMSYDRYITQHEQAEEKVIQSEWSLNEAQKLAKVGSWEFDLDTNYLTWSKQQYEIFEMEEAPANQLFELCRTKIHPDDLAQMDEAIRLGKEKGEAVIYQHRIICRDGSIKYLLGKGAVFKSENGKVNKLRGTVQDITESKIAEKTLRLVTQRLKQATEGAKIGVWEFDVINNVLVWEDSMFDLYGVKRKDFKGVFDAWKSVVHPEDVDAANEEVQAALRGDIEFDSGFRVIWPDKSVHYIKARATVLRDKEGKAVRMVGLNWDVTESKKAEELIIRSERSLNEAQKIAKVGNWELNLATMEQTWSKEHYRIFELDETPADKLYEAYRSKIHPDDIITLDNIISAAINNGGSFVFEHRVICNDGSNKYVIGKGATYTDSSGNTKFLRGTVQDITEQKKAEETNRKYAILESKSKEMEQFAYIASHDLREPLLTIKNYAELFADEYEGKLDKQSEEYLYRISRASNRMDELIKGLLDYSRLSKVKELQLVDCNKILIQVLADLDSLISNSSAKVYVEPLPELKVYPLELKQLFQNLLSNAIKFSREGVTPEIHISAEKKNGLWTFSFTDNGIGIDDADKEKIFGLFQRVHNRNQYAGSGIGLAYCKKIVELHHGNVWIDSVVGQGSSFYFTILT